MQNGIRALIFCLNIGGCTLMAKVGNSPILQSLEVTSPVFKEGEAIKGGIQL